MIKKNKQTYTHTHKHSVTLTVKKTNMVKSDHKDYLLYHDLKIYFSFSPSTLKPLKEID